MRASPAAAGPAGTLAADHRASDGYTGARYLTAVSDLLQKPEDLLEILGERTGRQITEDDYQQLATLTSTVKFLAQG